MIVPALHAQAMRACLTVISRCTSKVMQAGNTLHACLMPPVCLVVKHTMAGLAHLTNTAAA